MDQWRPQNDDLRKLETEERLKSYRSNATDAVGIFGAVAFWVSWSFAPLWLNVLLGVAVVACLAASTMSRLVSSNQEPPHASKGRDDV